MIFQEKKNHDKRLYQSLLTLMLGGRFPTELSVPSLMHGTGMPSVPAMEGTLMRTSLLIALRSLSR